MVSAIVLFKWVYFGFSTVILHSVCLKYVANIFFGGGENLKSNIFCLVFDFLKLRYN